MAGRDGVRVGGGPLLEQLVEAPLRQRPAPAGQPFDLVAEFVSGQQALPPGPGVRIGSDQFQRGAVVAEDPGRAVGVDHVGAVAQPQHQPSGVLGDPDPQHGVRVQFAAGGALGRVEHGLGGPAGQAQLAAEVADTEVLVREQL